MNPVWLSVSVKRLPTGGDRWRVPYRATVVVDDERAKIEVFVSRSAVRPDQAAGAIKQRILREINEMPSERNWIDYLKELEPIELSGREV